jgi:hypothetical protein
MALVGEACAGRDLDEGLAPLDRLPRECEVAQHAVTVGARSESSTEVAHQREAVVAGHSLERCRCVCSLACAAR